MDSLITICGLGVYPPAETTLETLQLLEACRVVFCDAADPKLSKWLAGYCREVRRPKDADEVLKEAKAGGEIGLAVWGHPEFCSRLAREVQLRCRKAKIPYRAAGAISPVASAFARSVSFLGGDYGYQGIQAYELSTLLEDPKALTPRLPLVVYAETAPGKDWDRLFSLINGLYPASLEVRFYPAAEPDERQATVGSLAALKPKGGVLLVPPETGVPAR
jgi:hypothetical protein